MTWQDNSSSSSASCLHGNYVLILKDTVVSYLLQCTFMFEFGNSKWPRYLLWTGISDVASLRYSMSGSNQNATQGCEKSISGCIFPVSHRFSLNVFYSVSTEGRHWRSSRSSVCWCFLCPKICSTKMNRVNNTEERRIFICNIISLSATQDKHFRCLCHSVEMVCRSGTKPSRQNEDALVLCL